MREMQREMYLFFGDMPEAVKTYIDQKQLPEVERIHSHILTALQYDFAKYGAKQQQEYLLSVFRYCACNIGKKVKSQLYTGEPLS
jgi:uncharacterized protein